MGLHLSIGGAEWVVVVFVALVLILGTGRLPDAARKLGRASARYRRARDEVSAGIGDQAGQSINVTGPVENERQKFETIARSLGMDPAGKDTGDLKRVVDGRIGRNEASNGGVEGVGGGDGGGGDGGKDDPSR